MKLIDRIAEIEHKQWMSWAKKLMETENWMSKERRERWEKLMVPYSELSEEWKEYDREWARHVLREIRLCLDEDTAHFFNYDDGEQREAELEGQKSHWYEMTQKLLDIKEELIAEKKHLQSQLLIAISIFESLQEYSKMNNYPEHDVRHTLCCEIPQIAMDTLENLKSLNKNEAK